MEVGPTGAFPQGQLNPDDKGGLVYAVGNDPATGKVIVRFETPVVWIGLNPQDAFEFARALKKAARKGRTN